MKALHRLAKLEQALMPRHQFPVVVICTTLRDGTIRTMDGAIWASLDEAKAAAGVNSKSHLVIMGEDVPQETFLDEGVAP